eukprot:3956768-Lingulodinium_polyedra.AAC.1
MAQSQCRFTYGCKAAARLNPWPASPFPTAHGQCAARKGVHHAWLCERAWNALKHLPASPAPAGSPSSAAWIKRMLSLEWTHL